jgi:hypothetical protein
MVDGRLIGILVLAVRSALTAVGVLGLVVLVIVLLQCLKGFRNADKTSDRMTVLAFSLITATTMAIVVVAVLAVWVVGNEPALKRLR